MSKGDGEYFTITRRRPVMRGSNTSGAAMSCRSPSCETVRWKGFGQDTARSRKVHGCRSVLYTGSQIKRQTCNPHFGHRSDARLCADHAYLARCDITDSESANGKASRWAVAGFREKEA